MFVAGVLITCIILLPMTIYKPYGLVSQGSVYTEDVIAYNDLYLRLFDVTGGAVDGDFLLISYYEVVGRGRATVSMNVLLNSARVDVVAVFVMGNTLELLDSKMLNNTYTYSFDTTSGKTYGVAVFGHKVDNDISVEIGFTVVI